MIEIQKQGADERFAQVSNEWMLHSYPHKYSYHFEWLGRPIIQYPQDTVALQEICWQIRPDLIIETGIAHGGSMALSASMLMACDFADAYERRQPLDTQEPKRKVLGIDVEFRQHNREALDAHPLRPYMTIIEGSSVDANVIREVRDVADRHRNVLVLLDSNHSHNHVLAELNAYAPLVTPGSYCIVYDTVIEDMPRGSFPDRNWDVGSNPKTAVQEFLGNNEDFSVDQTIEDKLQITVAPQGYLKRRKVM